MSRFLLFFAVLVPVFAFSAPSKIPPDSQVLTEVGKKDPAALRLPNRVNLLVWNMLKGENAGWEEAFDEVSSGANLILLQEGMLNPAVKTGIARRSEFQYTFAGAFYWEKFLTGIYSGSPALPIGRKFFRSQDREPFTNTPKMALRMDYVLESGKVLRVMNVHALNFADDVAHARQIKMVVDDLKTHDGPVILAGDFNIFNETRWNYVVNETSAIGLREVPVNGKPSVQNLDHIFVKGCDARSAWEKDTPASDHAFMLAVLDCE